MSSVASPTSGPSRDEATVASIKPDQQNDTPSQEMAPGCQIDPRPPSGDFQQHLLLSLSTLTSLLIRHEQLESPSHTAAWD